MSNKGKIHQYYYIDIRLACGKRGTTRILSVSRRQAILKALGAMAATDNIMSLSCSEGTPKSEHERNKKRNRKQAAQELKRKIYEERITVTTGVGEPSMTLYEWNQRKNDEK